MRHPGHDPRKGDVLRNKIACFEARVTECTNGVVWYVSPGIEGDCGLPMEVWRQRWDKPASTVEVVKMGDEG